MASGPNVFLRATSIRRRLLGSIPLLLVALAALVTQVGSAGASDYSLAFINGVPVPVHFNDGDSFRVFGGEYSGSQCRLAGFNTLESFGPGHQWGDWHPYELFINAKMATYNGRRGTWHCTTDGSRDGYGRLLMDCPDLVVDQIRLGLAHAYTIDDSPSPPEYLRAQQEAIQARRGMWAHGVPDFILTSLHSAHEDMGRELNSNRLISVRDGHTERMEHHDTYGECEWVCNTEHRVDEARIHEAARRLRADPRIAPLVAEYSNLLLEELASRWRRRHELPTWIEGPAAALVRARLEREEAEGLLGGLTDARGSCMIYAEFQRRYGRNRAHCLNGHGTAPPGTPWSHH
jgi:endonuclease YncB( thermonuclease family)